MTDGNSEVAHAIREELCRLGLVAPERADRFEEAVRTGTIKAEDWYSIIEASLPTEQGVADANQQSE